MVALASSASLRPPLEETSMLFYHSFAGTTLHFPLLPSSLSPVIWSIDPAIGHIHSHSLILVSSLFPLLSRPFTSRTREVRLYLSYSCPNLSSPLPHTYRFLPDTSTSHDTYIHTYFPQIRLTWFPSASVYTCTLAKYHFTKHTRSLKLCDCESYLKLP